MQPFVPAAAALNEDWGTEFDGKQVQRWAQHAGNALLERQQAELAAYKQGQRPTGPVNAPALMVIGMDGGRVQGREKHEDTGSRWREDKVLTISSYLPGDGEEKDPVPLVTTYLGTMHGSQDFGHLARLEAERRGIRQARQVVVLGDGAAWIDTLHEQHFFRHHRIVDWYHAKQHLYAVAKAAYPDHAEEQSQRAEALTTMLWEGHIDDVIRAITALSQRAGPPRPDDPDSHPRRVLAQNVTYFTRHREHMHYPDYRRLGWPIGSGLTEAGVKQFNKRVKGTEQFWNTSGVEPILTLRAMWLSQDQRWNQHWACHGLYKAA